MDLSEDKKPNIRKSLRAPKPRVYFEEEDYDAPQSSSKSRSNPLKKKADQMLEVKQEPGEEQTMEDVIDAVVKEKRGEKKMVMNTTRHMKEELDDGKNARGEVFVPLREPVYRAVPAKRMPPPPYIPQARYKSTRLARSSKPSDAEPTLDQEVEKPVSTVKTQNESIRRVEPKIVVHTGLRQTYAGTAKMAIDYNMEKLFTPSGIPIRERPAVITHNTRVPCRGRRNPINQRMVSADQIVATYDKTKFEEQLGLKPHSDVASNSNVVKIKCDRFNLGENLSAIQKMIQKPTFSMKSGHQIATAKQTAKKINASLSAQQRCPVPPAAPSAPAAKRIPPPPPPEYIARREFSMRKRLNIRAACETAFQDDSRENVRKVLERRLQNELLGIKESDEIVEQVERYERQEKIAALSKPKQYYHTAKRFHEQSAQEPQYGWGGTRGLFDDEDREPEPSIYTTLKLPSYDDDRLSTTNPTLATRLAQLYGYPNPVLKRKIDESTQIKLADLVARKAEIEKMNASNAVLKQPDEKTSRVDKLLHIASTTNLTEPSNGYERKPYTTNIIQVNIPKSFGDLPATVPVIFNGNHAVIPGEIFCHLCQFSMRLCMRRTNYKNVLREYPAYRCLRKGCQTFRSVKKVMQPDLFPTQLFPTSTSSSQYGEISYQTLLEANVRIEAAKKALNGITETDNDITDSPADNDEMLIKDEIDYGYIDFVSDDRTGLLRFPEPVEPHAQKQINTHTKKAVAANVNTEESTVKLEPIDDYESNITVLREENKPKIN